MYIKNHFLAVVGCTLLLGGLAPRDATAQFRSGFMPFRPLTPAMQPLQPLPSLPPLQPLPSLPPLNPFVGLANPLSNPLYPYGTLMNRYGYSMPYSSGYSMPYSYITRVYSYGNSMPYTLSNASSTTRATSWCICRSPKRQSMDQWRGDGKNRVVDSSPIGAG